MVQKDGQVTSQSYILVKNRIAGKFGGDNIWRIDSYKLFGEEKLGEWLSIKKIIIAWSRSVASFYALQ